MGDIIQPLKWIVGKDGFTLLDAEGKPLATVIGKGDCEVARFGCDCRQADGPFIVP